MRMVEFAQAVGVSLPSVQAVETGVTGDPSTILAALETLGHDPEKLRADYQAWREARAAEIRERLRA